MEEEERAAGEGNIESDTMSETVSVGETVLDTNTATHRELQQIYIRDRNIL